MLLRLAYLGVTNAFALLRLLPMSDREEASHPTEFEQFYNGTGPIGHREGLPTAAAP